MFGVRGMGGCYHHHARMGTGERGIVFIRQSALLFVPIPGWFGTDALAQLSAVLQSPVDCPAHPLGHPVPLGAVGQCEMEALPESQMNNSFGARESPRSARADIKSICLALPCPSALLYGFLVWSRGNASSCLGGGGREGGSRDHWEAGETLNEHAGWILLFLLKEDC